MFRGDRLRDARTRAGYSQAELGVMTQTSQDQVSRCERGAVEPSPETVLRYADILNVSVDWLYGRVNHPHEIVQKQELAEDVLRFAETVERFRSNPAELMRAISDFLAGESV